MLEDKLLLWKFKRGNEQAFRRIYEKYVDDLLTLAANLLRDTNVAEDIVQDVFTSFVQSAADFRLRGSLKAYLAVCVANKSRDRIRKIVRQKEQSPDTGEMEKTSAGNGPVHLAVQSEQLQKLQDAMVQLPYEQHEAITLRLHGGLKFRQIAQLQNVSIKTVQGRYRYGLEKLRSTLNHELEK